MGIRFFCPNGHKLNVKSFQAGRKGFCPYCGVKVDIPTQSVSGSRKDAAEFVPAAVAPADDDPAAGEPGPAIHPFEPFAPLNTPSAFPQPSPQPAAVANPVPLNSPAPLAPRGTPAPQAFELPTVALPNANVRPAATPAASPMPDFGRTPMSGFSGTPMPGYGGTPAPSFGTPQMPSFPAPVVGPVMPAQQPRAMPADPAPIVPQTFPTITPLPPTLPAPPAAAPDPLSEAPDAVWYVRPPSGGQYGPAASAIMRNWIQEGRVSADSLVWREGWPDWREAQSVFPQLSTGGVAVPSVDVGLGDSLLARRTVQQSELDRKERRTRFLVVLAMFLGVVFLVAVFLIVLFHGGRDHRSGEDEETPAPETPADSTTSWSNYLPVGTAA